MQNRQFFFSQDVIDTKEQLSPTLTADSEDQDLQIQQISLQESVEELTLLKQTSFKIIQEQIMSWFANKNIQHGNLQQIIDKLKQQKRGQVNKRIKNQKSKAFIQNKQKYNKRNGKIFAKSLSIIF